MRNQAEANLFALIESTEDLIWSVDLEGRLLAFNRALQQDIKSRQNIQLRGGMKSEEWLPPARAAVWDTLFARVLGEGRVRAEIALPDGRTLDLALNRIVELGKTTGVSVFAKDVTERKQAEKQLRDSEERFRATFEQAAVGLLHTSFEGKILRCNARFAEIVGYTVEEITGLSFQQLTPPEDMASSLTVLEEMTAGRTDSASFEKRYVRKDGSHVWVRLTTSMQRDGEGRPLHFIALVEDIDGRKAAEERLAATQEALRASEARYHTTFNTSLDAIHISRLSDRICVDCNRSLLDLLGYEREEVVGRSSLELHLWADPADRLAMEDSLRRTGRCRDLVARFRAKNGNFLWGRMSASVIDLEGVPCILSMTRDISAAKSAEDEIKNLAFYDPLTSLPNRRFLLEQLRQTLAAGARNGRKRALLLVDLDKLKSLNETLGHQSGDLLLQESARRLIGSVRESDTVARLGGDEFVVMIEDLSSFADEAAAQARMVAEKLLAAVGQPYMLAGRECQVTSSIGINVFGNRLEGSEEVLQQAELAMRQAKTAGGNTICAFEPSLQAAVNARANLEEDLRQAIKGQQFLLYYQPQVEQSRLNGAEALLRWRHPHRGLLAPGEFIPLAEETGLILPMGNWVLETACLQIAEWGKQAETANLTVAVNVSARQLRQPDFVEQVLGALRRTGANPRNLKLELTESMLVDNFEDVISKMIILNEHGLRFSLDDFGTGYSSLSYLKRLPLEQLKIDRSFVRDILTDLSSGAIAQTIISLSHAMGLSVIAEGVETEAQRRRLAGLGCHSFQGYLFSRPVPVEEFEQMLRRAAAIIVPTMK
jgi:diguanylate cyclase (GGDEF)-like protein/PAS domain S-box-containing protein